MLAVVSCLTWGLGTELWIPRSTFYHQTLTLVSLIRFLCNLLAELTPQTQCFWSLTHLSPRKNETNDFPVFPREVKKEMLPLVLQLSNEIIAIVNFYSPSTLPLSRFFFMLVKCMSVFQLATFLITLICFPQSPQH